ncbi:MAG: hypothetical protein LBD16_01390 [Oscillospiraceae bacterium]|jgi:alpha-beta hydrolase superfamily lysophospholipase|nr:hypothetical protein [Oscillospiraceae bacterium]
METKKSLMKRSEGWLALALVLILLGSFLGGLFNTSFYQTKVTEIEFETERGTLNGLLYMPKGAGADDPRPVIITTHGYLNTKEMQDAPAIEMSRRGYIVLALDMYDHGDSRWAADIPTGGQFSTFWVYSQFDAAAYIYEQPYTLKDEAGNAYAAVSGHSMGGFSSYVAVYMDEMRSLQAGNRLIFAALPAGADLSYAAAIAPMDQLLASFGSRTMGVVAAHYDEFFFNKSADEKSDAEKQVAGTVVYKDYPATAQGKMFLGLPADGAAGVADTYYSAEAGAVTIDGNVVREAETGERVIFTPTETHPWNHFSTTSTAYMIDFYAHAFSGVLPASMTNAGLASSNQIWLYKELAGLIALIGFFLLIVPVVSLLLRLPFFKKAVHARENLAVSKDTAGQKALYWLGIAAGTLIPAIFFPAFMDKTSTLKILGIIAAVIAALGIAAAVYAGVSKKKLDELKASSWLRGGIWVAVLACATSLLLFFASSIVKLGALFNEPTVNQIAYWAIISGFLTALISVGIYYFNRRPKGATFESYGIRPNALTIVSSLFTALVGVAIAYAILFLTQFIFGVDYRVWVLAVRTFKSEHVITALRYAPLFFLYYFPNTVAINANTRGRKAGYLLAVIMNIGGLALWMAGQYGMLFAKGTAMVPNQALNGILLVALIPCLAIAAVFARKVTEKTGSVWLGAFLNTILFTLISCANTAMFWNLV